MSHTVEECDLNTHYFNECDEYGELSQCTCLDAWVDSWSISRLTFPLSFAVGATYAYDYVAKGGLVEIHGYASSYGNAMDRIAHAVICGEEAE